MHIASQTPQQLVVKDDMRWVSLLMVACTVIIIFFCIAQNKPNGLYGASIFLLVAMVADRKTTFTFDAMQRFVFWSGHKFLKTESGTIPFDDITDIGIEITSGAEEGTSYRLSILTANGSVPMAYAYTGSSNACASPQKNILDFVKPGSPRPSQGTGELSSGIPADLAPSIRSLLQQRRKIDAITLLRENEKIGLTEAVKRVNEMDRKMKTGN